MPSSGPQQERNPGVLGAVRAAQGGLGVAVVLFAIADLQVVQWTSGFVRPRFLLFCLALNLPLLLATAELLALLTAVGRRVAGLRADAAASGTVAVIGLFVLFNLSRAGTEDVGIADPTLLPFVGAVTTLAGWEIHRSRRWRAPMLFRSRSWLLLAPVLAPASALVWVVVGAGRRELPFLVPALLALLVGVIDVIWVARLLRLVWRRAVWEILVAEHSETRDDGPPPCPRVVPTWSQAGVVAAVNVAVLATSFTTAPGMAAAYAPPPATSGAVTVRAPDVVLALLGGIPAGDAESLASVRWLADRATTFSRAYAVSPAATPSHASLMTGLRPGQHKAHPVVVDVGAAGGERRTLTWRMAQQPLPDEHVTLAEMLAGRGYRTAAIVAGHDWVAGGTGLLQGFEHVDARPNSLRAAEPMSRPLLRGAGPVLLNVAYDGLRRAERSASEVLTALRRWEQGRGDGAFFLFVHLAADSGPAAAVADGEPTLRAADPAELDARINELFGLLERRDVLDDALVVVTGEPPGSVASGASHALAEARVRVPLVVKLPGQRQRRAEERVAQVIDVVPTILRAVEMPVPPELPGTSLGEAGHGAVVEDYLDSLDGQPSATFEGTELELQDAYPTSWAVVHDGWKLVVGSDGERRLYDLRADPGEIMDVIRDEEEIAEALYQRLLVLLPPDAFDYYLRPSAGRRSRSLAGFRR